jgi:hypothetical protein
MRADGRSRLRAAFSVPCALHFGVAFFQIPFLTNKTSRLLTTRCTWFRRSNSSPDN